MAAKNPVAPPMRDTLGMDERHNHGIVATPAGQGGDQVFLEPYGLDRSTMAGSAQDERMTERGFGGSTTNLSHSLKGVNANQTGRSRG